MQPEQPTQPQVVRILAPFLCAISVANLFPACNSSGLGRKGSTAPDGSTLSDAGTGETGGTATGGAGGTTETGGIASSGGITTFGGSTATGGGPSTGGIIVTGGVIVTAGVTISGGITQSGGVTSSGGVTNSGGTTSSGGITSSGGVTRSGGVTATGGGPTGHFQAENLDRGVVAVKVAGGVYVGWRMFGYEYNASNVAYNLYRSGTRLATVTDSTNYLDASATTDSIYTVTAVVNGSEGPQSPAATPWAQDYLRIPMEPPLSRFVGQTYEANEGSPGDLDGDGQYEIVLKWEPSAATDSGIVNLPVLLDAYTLAGKRLWRIDLGPNIPPAYVGAESTQFVVYDFDGDGKAEVAVKTAPGTKDGTGVYLHTGPAATDDDSAAYCNGCF